MKKNEIEKNYLSTFSNISTKGKKEVDDIQRDKNIVNYKFKLNEELIKMINNEREKDIHREKLLAVTLDYDEKKKIEKLYGIERAKAAVKIIKFSK